LQKNDAPLPRLAITGASSFIGQHLTRSLQSFEDVEMRLLIHKRRPQGLMEGKRTQLIEGDLLQRGSSMALLERDCTVIHLAYLQSSPMQENLEAMEHLVESGVKAGIRRLVHCSTATVVGGVRDEVITEDTPCEPRDEYETAKFRIEALLQEKARAHFELVILRPTAVFGPGGRNLLKLAHDLSRGSGFVNYAKSCLFDSRRMNLVSVDDVVSALRFLACAPQPMGGEVFIISDDEDPANNYRDVEDFLIRELACKGYPLPRIPMPSFLLSSMLKLAGRSNTNPNRIYRSEKIRNAGFQKKMSLEAALSSFAAWYRRTGLLSERAT
jgi:nucleoside-diphosphate-sugar epimerase